MDEKTELERRAEEFARRIGAANVPRSTAREEQIKEFARRIGSRHVPLSAARAEEISEFARRIGSRHVPLSAPRRQEVRDFVRRITEGDWDSAKHPRGGNPQNRGEFSAAGGAAAEPGQRAGREGGQHGSDAPERLLAEPPRDSAHGPQIILAGQKVERKLFYDWVKIESDVKKGLADPTAKELEDALKKAFGAFIKEQLAKGLRESDLADFINSSPSLRTLLGFGDAKGKFDVNIKKSGSERKPKYEIKIAPYGKVGNALDTFSSKHDVSFEGGLHILIVR